MEAETKTPNSFIQIVESNYLQLQDCGSTAVMELFVRSKIEFNDRCQCPEFLLCVFGHIHEKYFTI